VAGAALIAVCLPAIAVTAIGMAAVVGVIAGAAVVAGSVAMLATDVATDGCIPCMREAFVRGLGTGAQVGFDVAMMVLTAGAAGPGLAFVGGGTTAAVAITRAITGVAIGAAAAVGIASMSSSSSGGGGWDDDDERPRKQKAKDRRKAQQEEAQESKGKTEGTPGNNQAQNREFDDAARGLDKAQRRQLHDAISKQNMTREEIIAERNAMFPENPY